ncbi:MAG TPA: hypothetical protein ENI72_00235 [Rhodospirillales bacterium]|nr:hypothetical protein [Rhodospirillales bacterium]
MNRTGVIFCTLSLVVALFFAWGLYPFAAMAPEKLAAWTVAAEPEDLPDINLGEFGTVSVSDLMGYYIENPPVAATPGAAPIRPVRFQGC